MTAAAAVAAIALLGVEVGHLDHRLNQVTAASAGQTLTAAARNALLDPSAQRITLTGVGPGPSPGAVVVVQPSGAAFLFNQGLPALPPGQTYQLWAMIDGQPISVGVLGAHPATVAFSLDTAADHQGVRRDRRTRGRERRPHPGAGGQHHHLTHRRPRSPAAHVIQTPGRWRRNQ